MTDHEHGNGAERREPDLSVLGDDVAHPFDQTNGIVEGLEGNADDPGNVQERTGADDAPEILAPLVDGADDNRDDDSEDETRP